MNKLETALALWAVASDGGRAKPERIAALDELSMLKKRSKVSWSKLGREDTDVGNMRVQINQEPEPKPILVSDLADVLEEATGNKPKITSTADGCTVSVSLKDPVIQAQAEGQPIPKAAAVRGLISAEVRRLLLASDAPYAELVLMVKAKFPEANTTARSIASTASEMRSAGKAVAQRRREAAK